MKEIATALIVSVIVVLVIGLSVLIGGALTMWSVAAIHEVFNVLEPITLLDGMFVFFPVWLLSLMFRAPRVRN